jgi:hypothetical protein
LELRIVRALANIFAEIDRPEQARSGSKIEFVALKKGCAGGTASRVVEAALLEFQNEIVVAVAIQIRGGCIIRAGSVRRLQRHRKIRQRRGAGGKCE